MSIGWQTPDEAHTQCGEQRRCGRTIIIHHPLRFRRLQKNGRQCKGERSIKNLNINIMALPMSSYHVLREHIDRIRKADENHCRHMWDEYKQDALNEFIDALADLATDVEFSILKKEMPQEEKERLEKLEYEEWIKEEVEM